MAFYRDINQTTFKVKPYVTDVNSVVQAVRNLISTREGERPFRPNYGINIVDYLFELMDVSAGLQLLSEVQDKLAIFEPRVTLDLQQSNAIPDEETNSFEISLFFTIEGFDGEIFNVTENVRQ